MQKAKSFNQLLCPLLLFVAASATSSELLVTDLVQQARMQQALKLAELTPDKAKQASKASEQLVRPKLWSVYGSGAKLHADLLLGSQRITVNKGDINRPISEYWRLSKLDAQGVTLTFIAPASTKSSTQFAEMPTAPLRLQAPGKGVSPHSMLSKQ